MVAHAHPVQTVPARERGRSTRKVPHIYSTGPATSLVKVSWIVPKPIALNAQSTKRSGLLYRIGGIIPVAGQADNQANSDAV